MNQTSLLQKAQAKLDRLERINNELDEKIKFYSSDTQDSDTTFVLQTLITQKEAVEQQIKAGKKSLKNLKKNGKKEPNPILVKVGSKQKTFRIVDTEMVDPKNGYISDASPLANMLKDKKAGEEFIITTPVGQTVYKIISK